MSAHPGRAGRPGRRIAPSTIWAILTTTGAGPPPRRTGPTWTESLTAQVDGLLACDFLHIDTSGQWVAQVARNLMLDLGERAARFRFLIREGDATYTATFDAVFEVQGVQVQLTPPQAPGPTPSRSAGYAQSGGNAWTGF